MPTLLPAKAAHRDVHLVARVRLLLVRGKLLFEARNLRLLLTERVHQALQRLPVDLGAGLLCAKNGVAERLGRFVGELTSAIR